MQITDRAKDVIKSGGEWISSIELENAAIGAPGVQEAAAVGVYHPKWDERPILLIVKKPGAAVNEAGVIDYLKDRVAKWRSEEHTSELQSLMRITYAVFCLKKNRYIQSIQYTQNVDNQ